MTNTQRCRLLASRKRSPRFKLGELVREPYGDLGIVDKIFADLEAAFDAHEIGPSADKWYSMQNRRPKTPKDGIWYGVILFDKLYGGGGAVLAGEDDLVPVTD